MDTSLRTFSSVQLPSTTPSGNNAGQSGKTLPSLATGATAEVTRELPKQQVSQVSEGDKSLVDEMKDTREAVRKINDALRDQHRDIEFSVHEASGKTVVKVIHSESGEVIRQFPPEVVLDFASAFTEGSASLLEDFA